ncbi:MAG TPA: UDP-N-acetylmuramate dehydrogenase [Patescibacteria group bacterium]|nr:UDP-N-acetylmuramate dehydrogenase [Patescibacteria group bacterium]
MNFNLEENVPLKNLTTFHLGGPARYFVVAENLEDLKSSVSWAKEKEVPVFVLGGGSNLVVSDIGFPGLVIQVKIAGLEILHEDEEQVLLKVGAGVRWDEVVDHAVACGWWGIENMSLIYGTLGGIIVQNAGAYGTEIASVVNHVEIYDREVGEAKEFFADDCHFGYRSSLFQNNERYLIIAAVLELKKNGTPNIKYPDVIKYFAEKNITVPSLSDIRTAIVSIRQNKLPDPEVLGSAGSFFKNLLLTPEEYQNLKEKITANFNAETVAQLEGIKNKFPVVGAIKIPTAWILDVCGLKGERVGAAVVYEKQPIILTNQDNAATADDIMNLVKKIRQTVFAKTGVKLEMEPELVGFGQKEIDGYFRL